MRIQKRRILVLCIAVLAAWAFVFHLGILMRDASVEQHRTEAKRLLSFYRETITLELYQGTNEAQCLAAVLQEMDPGQRKSWFQDAAVKLLEREEAVYAALFDEDAAALAFPEESYGGQAGRNLKKFPYIYTMPKVLKDLVVDGPVCLEETGASVFLFFAPIMDGTRYAGEVVVGLDADYVIEKLGLDYFAEHGYDYELWRVNPQNGEKAIVIKAGKSLDFSHAVKDSFNVPIQWTISIQPFDGWLYPSVRYAILLFCFGLDAVLALAIWGMYRTALLKRSLRDHSKKDLKTGMYSQMGFAGELDRWIFEGKMPFPLFYFVMEEYRYVARMVGSEAENAYLQDMKRHMNSFIKSSFIAGQISDGCFAVAVDEVMDHEQMENFARGLALELLWKVPLDDKKMFLNSQYAFIVCRDAGRTGEEYLSELIGDFYKRLKQDSPVSALTEKCRQLIKGKTNVVFDEYSDPEMMELSRTLNQYRKKVQRLEYYDMVFRVGNRLKYTKDIDLLISYDRRRPCTLFCVDICSFSRYNELFSVTIGDAILRETISRLSRLFGDYLYRINGDVFLGVVFTETNIEEMMAKIRESLSEPVCANNHTFSLNIRIAVCQHTSRGDTPEILLNRLQSALEYCKKNELDHIIYNHELDEILSAGTRILKLLRSSIKDHTLEVWYQPLWDVKRGCFPFLEALLRLPDGAGGYFPACQVIAVAEQNSIMEQVGDYVLEQACRFAAECREKYRIRSVGINLSVQQLMVNNCANHFLEIITAAGLEPQFINLEITESILIQSVDKAAGVLEKLQQAGVLITLDDFGNGYSGLNYLSNLPVDIIKIDRSLIHQVLDSPKQRSLLGAVITMAEINDLIVVVEGVETQAERDLICEFGADYIQGYYYAKPMPRHELEKFLQRKLEVTENI